MSINLYEVDNKYIDYLVPFAPHMFRNRQPGQQNERKYIGVVIEVDNIKYFAALSSYKPKHDKMKESIDLIKVGRYAVINLNLIIPVPDGYYAYVDISKEKNPHYRSLLLAEYRIIKKLQDRIRKNAATIYKHKLQHGNETALAKRCNDFKLLEEKAALYSGK